jgi:hypothetical protein
MSEMRLAGVVLGYLAADRDQRRARAEPEEEPRRRGAKKRRGTMQLSVELDPTSAVRTESPQDGPPVPRFDAGRVCEVAGCWTVLSVYNDGERCWSHRPMERVTPLRNHRK